MPSPDDKRRALAALSAMTDEEDAAITAAAASDPDNPEWTDADFARARPAAAAHPDLVASMAPKRRGRPPTETRKDSVKLRIDPDVLAAYRATGPGWQTRMQEVLRKGITDLQAGA